MLDRQPHRRPRSCQRAITVGIPPFSWEKWPIAIATPVLSGDLLLFSEAHKGALLLRLGQKEQQVEKLWHRRGKRFPRAGPCTCLISTPYIDVSTSMARTEAASALPASDDGRASLGKMTGPRSRRTVGRPPSDPPGRPDLAVQRARRANHRAADAYGFQEISRTKLIEPTTGQLPRRDGSLGHILRSLTGMCSPATTKPGPDYSQRREARLTMISLRGGGRFGTVRQRLVRRYRPLPPQQRLGSRGMKWIGLIGPSTAVRVGCMRSRRR